MKKYSFYLLVCLILIKPLFSSIITLVATTNVNGEIDPCGWPKKPLGGLARKATYIDELYSNDINPIIVDAGNVIIHLFRSEIRELYSLEKLWDISFDSLENRLA